MDCSEKASDVPGNGDRTAVLIFYATPNIKLQI